MPRAGIVTVVGKPNAGKSTLLNRIMGEKLAIVSEKPQSTRNRVVGIRTTDDVQMIILDTPGLLNPRYELQRAMRSTALRALKDADVVVMAAAVADYRPASIATSKMKKTHHDTPGAPDDSAPTITLVRNPDVLAGLVEGRGAADRPVIVGFAAETGDAGGSVLDHARAKLARKGCDLLVANEVGDGLAFGTDGNTVHLLFRQGLTGAPAQDDRVVGPAPKAQVAAAVWDGIQVLLEHR